MTQYKKIVKRSSIVALAGTATAAIALATSSAFDQTVDPPQQFPSNAPEQAAAAPPAPLAQGYDPDLLNLRGAQGLGATPATPAADPSLSGFGADVDQARLQQLREKMKQLQEQLRKTPTSLEEQQQLQQVAIQLAETQAQIQRLEFGAGQYAAYRRARELNEGLGAIDDPNAPQASVPNDLTQSYPGAQAANAFVRDRARALNASGLDSGSFGARVGGGANAISLGEAQLLREQKERLTQQYRQLQQTFRALQPGEAQLAEGLRAEQTALLAQLKEIDSKLANAPQLPNALNNAAANAEPFQIPSANQLQDPLAIQNDPNALNVKMDKVSQAARLLREAGLVQLANYAAAEQPKLADPNYKEQSLVPGAWSEADGLAEERYNPFQQISREEVQKIADSVLELQNKIDAMTERLNDVNAQLTLLTRNSAQMIEAPKETNVAPEQPAGENVPNVEQKAEPNADLPVPNDVPVDDANGSFEEATNAADVLL